MWKIACVLFLALAGPAARVHAQAAPDSAPAADARDPNLLTRDDLRVDEGTSLYAALRRLRPYWVHWDPNFGHPMVYVDSVARGMPSVLENIPAAVVQWVQFSDGREARIRFGRRHPQGVIFVSTQTPPSAASPPVPEVPPFETRTGLSVSTNGVLPLEKAHEFAGRSRFPGLDVAVVVPGRTRMAWLAGVSWSSIAWDVPTSAFEPPAPSEDGGLLSATVGMKRYMGESQRSAPYFETSLGAFRATRKDQHDFGFGLVGGVGIDVRLSEGFAAFSAASFSLIRFTREPGSRFAGAGGFGRLQFGLTTYFAPRPPPAAP